MKISLKWSILPLFAVGLSILLVMRDIMGMNISKFVYLVYIVAFMAVSPYETVVRMTCFILPLVCGLPGTYIMPCVLVLLMIKRKHINAWQIGMLAFATMLELIAAFWYEMVFISDILQYVSFAGVLFFLIHDDSEIDFMAAIRMYLWGTCLLCGTIVLSTLMHAPSDWLSRFAKGWFRFGDEHVDENAAMQLRLNANSLAYYSVVGALCSIFAAERVKDIKKPMYIVMAIFMVITGLLTVSRSWLLVMAICLMLYILGKAKSLGKVIRTLVIFAVVYFFGSLLFSDTPEILEGMVARMNQENTWEGGGRVDAFINYLDTFFLDIRTSLIGAGVTRYRVVLEKSISTHNGVLQILVCTGIIGFLGYMVGLLKPVLQYGKKRSMSNYMPWIGTVLFVQTIQFLNPMMLMLPYIIGIYTIRAKYPER